MRRRSARRAFSVAIAAVISLGLVAGAAQADKLQELENRTRDLESQRAANQERQEQLSSELEGTDASLQAVYLEITKLDGEIPIAEAELAQAEEDLAAAERHLESVQGRLAVAQSEATTLEDEIAQSEAEIASTEDDIAELARSTYRGSDGLSALTLVVDASSPKEFTERAVAYDVAMRSQTQVLDELEDTAAQQRNSQARLDAVNVRIGELQVEAEEAVVAADEARDAAEEHRNNLQNMRAERKSKAAELEGLMADIESQQQQIASDDEALKSQIAGLYQEQAAERERQRLAEEERQREAAAERQRQQEEAAKRAAESGNGGGGGGQAPAPAPAPPSSSGPGLSPPVAAPFHVTSPFGMRIYPITGGRYMHNGTDIRSACGNAQYAAASGTVVGVRGAAGNGTHGNQVLIDHGVINGDSYVTVYNHLSRFNVSNGQGIGKGDVLGYTGMTGKVTGCHVHVEVWKNGSPINPETLSGWTRSN